MSRVKTPVTPELLAPESSMKGDMVTVTITRSCIAAARKRRFSDALGVLKKAADILVKKYHARKIVLIGSLIDENRFGVHSDIDLCVEGIPNKLYFQAVGDLLLLSDEFDIDVIPLENATTEMREQAMKGKVLHEKR